MRIKDLNTKTLAAGDFVAVEDANSNLTSKVDIGTEISNINSNLTAASFDLTRDTTNVTSGSGKGIYDKASKTVRIYLQWNNTANVSANATLFTIPSAYRPSAAVTGYGIVRTSGDVPLPAAYSVSTAGAVAQTASNAARGGFSMIEYILD